MSWSAEDRSSFGQALCPQSSFQMSAICGSGRNKRPEIGGEGSADSNPSKHCCLSPSANSEQRTLDYKREDCLSDVSIVLPVHNAARWLGECLQSVLGQDFQGSMQLSVFNDASKDGSMNIIRKWGTKLENRGIHVVLGGHESSHPKGVGFAKNRAIAQSCGRFLCFLDADDVMMPQRVRLQYEAAIIHTNCIIGCQVKREPEGSTERYTRWINSLTQEQLVTQVFTSHGPTVIMPTWFCSREWFDRIGMFDEGGKGVPEDLLFFYENLRKGGGIFRVDHCLLLYRYHSEAATHAVLEETIWKNRVRFLEERVLSRWPSFTIWNAGKQGRKLYRSLSANNQKKDLTGGGFEENLNSLKLKEGVDYYHFS
ncbi:queuosine-tRNA galactosyltransferase isoform X3 [Mustelus asterias]